MSIPPLLSSNPGRVGGVNETISSTTAQSYPTFPQNTQPHSYIANGCGGAYGNYNQYNSHQRSGSHHQSITHHSTPSQSAHGEWHGTSSVVAGNRERQEGGWEGGRSGDVSREHLGQGQMRREGEGGWIRHDEDIKSYRASKEPDRHNTRNQHNNTISCSAVSPTSLSPPFAAKCSPRNKSATHVQHPPHTSYNQSTSPSPYHSYIYPPPAITNQPPPPLPQSSYTRSHHGVMSSVGVTPVRHGRDETNGGDEERNPIGCETRIDREVFEAVITIKGGTIKHLQYDTDNRSVILQTASYTETPTLAPTNPSMPSPAHLTETALPPFTVTVPSGFDFRPSEQHYHTIVNSSPHPSPYNRCICHLTVLRHSPTHTNAQQLAYAAPIVSCLPHT
eukprot:GHVQ01033314.1.p1 GENE.GHVQ01033314.1~~GHVQ01033314.1.p1  ORF type:complete len:391 (+),score=85.03 GHVQ01033314.1:2-1174(+)